MGCFGPLQINKAGKPVNRRVDKIVDKRGTGKALSTGFIHSCAEKPENYANFIIFYVENGNFLVIILF